MTRINVLILLIGICLTASSPAQQAVTPGLQSYDVELVIFRSLKPKASPEQWGLEAAAAGQRLTIPQDDQVPFITSEGTPPAIATYPSVPEDRLKLTAVVDALRRSRDYQPIAHIGWTQPGYPRDAARFLPVNSLLPASSGVMGQIGLSRGRYLHLTIDLVLDQDGERYVLRQTRRMRSNERHYIDHPNFGVIAVITPVKEG
jgi:hypothetical protein